MGFTDWFHLDKTLLSQDGINIEVYSFNYDEQNQTIMSEWASRFRNNYCLDDKLDRLRRGTLFSRKEYLLIRAFPDRSVDFGPATRAGDFSEILVADFLEFLENYWVPSRIRYQTKATRNSSTQGCDVVAFKIKDDTLQNSDDEALVVEVKAKYSKNVPDDNRLGDAVCDSGKDPTRYPEFLNYAKKRFLDTNDDHSADLIERFQDSLNRPYKMNYGAAAFFDKIVYSDAKVESTDCSAHPQKSHLRLLVVTGVDMMKLVHSLYERAAREA